MTKIEFQIINHKFGLLHLMMFIYTLVVVLIFGFRYQLTSQVESQVRANRELTITLNTASEQRMMDFIQRTVNRWESLQRANPKIKVPHVDEPAPTPVPIPSKP